MKKYVTFSLLTLISFDVVQAESATPPTARHISSAVKQKKYNQPYNAWSALSTYSRKDPHTASLSTTQGNMASVGVDGAFLDKYRLGVSYTYSNDRINTIYNSGNVKCKSDTIAPYFVYPIVDNTTAMFLVGHGWVRSNTVMLDSGVNASGSNRTKTHFAGAYVTYAKKMGDLSPSIRGGYLYYNAKSGAYTLSNNRFIDGTSTYRGLVSTSFRCGYKTSEFTEPYVEGGLEWEAQRPKNTQPKARMGWNLGAGVSLQDKNSPCKFQLGYVRARSTVKVDEHRFMLRITTKL